MFRRSIFPSLALTGALAAPARLAAQPAALSDRIAQVMARPEFKHAMFGVKVIALDDGATLYALNADKLFVPGSTTKLLTVGTGYAALGADFRFHTKLYRTGPVVGGVVQGDLVLVASGDPNLSHRIRGDSLLFVDEDHTYGSDPDADLIPGDPLTPFRGLAKQLRERGIKRVDGRVRIDTNLFTADGRELGTGVMLSAITVNDNVVDLVIRPGSAPGVPARITASPETGFLKVINRVVTVADHAVPADVASDSLTPAGTRVITVAGRLVAGGKGQLLTYKPAEPERLAAWGLTRALTDAGIAVRPPVVVGRPARMTYRDDQLVAEHVSPPYREAAKVVLKVSHNVHASTLPYVIGALRGKEPTAQGGFDVEHEFLAGAGLDLSGAVQSDGAGGAALYTPEFMTSYLAFIAKQPYAEDFRRGLPILGVDGTLAQISRGAPAAGHVTAKTGTFVSEDKLNHGLVVDGKGLAGYLTTKSGRRLAFAIYINRTKLDDPAKIQAVVGQAAGDIAAAVYDTVP